MRIYSFGCDGIEHAVVEVIDCNVMSARRVANAHLMEIKRAELIPQLDYTGNRPVQERDSIIRPRVT